MSADVMFSAILDHLALHGATPGPGETDRRPLPQPDEVELTIATLFGTTIGLLTSSQLEDHLEEVLWSLTSICHRRLTHIQKLLDDTNSRSGKVWPSRTAPRSPQSSSNASR
ncbi:hypothetical protein [Seohaeicola zhoushanensis]|uniref:hypothetical protein n=1 Tax=Seohaeicola zhoushanensis TaxID=1569283 RepID=UPI001E51040C|nr:hypothetical protein [Seohaeicola zhoushanensis]